MARPRTAPPETKETSQLLPVKATGTSPRECRAFGAKRVRPFLLPSVVPPFFGKPVRRSPWPSPVRRPLGQRGKLRRPGPFRVWQAIRSEFPVDTRGTRVSWRREPVLLAFHRGKGVALRKNGPWKKEETNGARAKVRHRPLRPRPLFSEGKAFFLRQRGFPLLRYWAPLGKRCKSRFPCEKDRPENGSPVPRRRGRRPEKLQAFQKRSPFLAPRKGSYAPVTSGDGEILPIFFPVACLFP